MASQNSEGAKPETVIITVDQSESSTDPKDEPVADNVDGKIPSLNSTSDKTGENHLNGPTTPTDQPSPRTRRSARTDAELTETELLLASTLILDAKRGRNMNFKSDEKSIHRYILYHHIGLRWTLYFFIFLYLALAVFEKPAVPPVGIPYWGTILLEIVCLGFFIFRICHAASFDNPGTFARDTKNVVVVVLIILCILDIITYTIWINAAPDHHPVRWSRPLRPLFIVNFSDGKQIRRAFRNIRRTVPDISNVLILFLASVLLFALLALKLFAKRKTIFYPDGRPYFKTYLDSIWDLYVLVTTANNPDVMMPAYDQNKAFAFFFVIYLIICLYIFMSIVLAAIYNNFKKNLKNEVRVAVYSKRQKLSRAFDILKVHKSQTEVVIPHKRWSQVMKLVVPGHTQAQIDLMLKVLDSDGSNSIHKREFLYVSELLHLQLTEVQDRQNIFEKHIPEIYASRASKILRNVVRHRAFRIFFDFLIFLNAWFIGFDVDKADWFFLALFMLEIFLKLYTISFKEFFIRFWNIFDFFVIFAAAIVSIVEKARGLTNEEFEALDVLLVLRVMRLIKLFGSIHRFKTIIMTIVNIGPSIITYGGVIFVFYYFFAIIGMELFQGLITYHGYNESALRPDQFFCGNPALNGSAFYNAHYCSNNFNNVLNALVVLFELTVVNQWHVLSSGFVEVTHVAARLYFFLFHMFVVVIVVNIFTAFVIEAFILEYSLQRVPKLESQVEKKIKELGLGTELMPKRGMSVERDDMELVGHEVLPATKNEEEEESDSDDDMPDFSHLQGTRFHLKKKSRKKVEVLLHQMFENEIDAEDTGPIFADENPALQEQPLRRPTLEAVT